jgi:K+-sensing histidine kinase KdpD
MSTLDRQSEVSLKSFELIQYNQSMERLVAVVQSLSMARTLDAIIEIVRVAARDLTRADGATFVLREGDLCYYAEENALEPLWKGRRFPMDACISGWVMLNREAAAIEDIYQDSRIPQDAYKPTFVKSLVMVPIRTQDPIGAIGNYWASPHHSSKQEIRLLQALADTTAVAMENVRLYTELEQKVQERTAQLQMMNQELEAFSYSVSHDLRAPLRTISGFSTALVEDCHEQLDACGKDYLNRITKGCQHMNELIEGMLGMARLSQGELSIEPNINLTDIAEKLIDNLKRESPERQVQIKIQPNLKADGDRHLLEAVLQNLLGNAWKFTSKETQASIEFGEFGETTQNNEKVFYVKDNGDGFDMAYANNRLFTPFQRLHHQEEFPGTGVGLATVQRIIHKHSGRIWAESKPKQGATFYFTLARHT